MAEKTKAEVEAELAALMAERTVISSSGRTVIVVDLDENGAGTIRVVRDGRAQHFHSLEREGQGEPDTPPGRGVVTS